MSARLIFPQSCNLADWLNAPLMPAYAEETIACLGEFSRLLLSLPGIKLYPDITALGYWLRTANLKKIAEQKLADKTRLLRPVGNVLHIAPSNIDTLFFYSGALSLLTGNRNLIRLSRRRGESHTLILDALHQLYQQNRWRPVLDRLYLFESEHEDAFLLEACQAIDLRIIWGGDSSITNVRKIPISAHCRELTFPDKFSLALLGSAELLKVSEAELNSLIQKFVNDSYSFGQQACSSPRAIIWLGTSAETEIAKEKFWSALAYYLRSTNYPRTSTEQMQAFISAQLVGCHVQHISIHSGNHWFCRLDIIDPINSRLEQCHHGNALFYELSITNLQELKAHLQQQHQTLSYWGLDIVCLLSWLQLEQPLGIDRVIPLGQSLKFNHLWDGIDIPNQMTRSLTLK